MLDLFSGLGGFSYALHSICKTVAYCECDRYAVACLKGAIHQGLIDAAPIFTDVRTLNPTVIPGRLDVISAGFPCTDLSSMGSRSGFLGQRSQLVWQVFRVLDMRPDVRVVMIENSPRLSNDGLSEICSEFQKRGFQFAWGIFPAAEVGAPHRRDRLYAVAQRGLLNLPALSLALFRSDWHSKEPCPRVIRKTDRAENRVQLARLMLLGNAVVPQVVYRAFTVLHSAILGNLQDYDGGRATMKAICVIREGRAHIMQRPDLPKVRPPRSKPNRVEWNGLQCTQQVWPTPISQNWRQCRFLASRTCKTLVNQIFYDTATSESLGIETPRNMLSLEWMINPTFVEYLMGYPQGYTAGTIKMLDAASAQTETSM
jgi:hypothetical protein